MCRHYETIICSIILCEWLLYTTCVVNRIQLYVAQCYLSVYYKVHVLPGYRLCRLMLFERLLYCYCVVTVIPLYVAQFYVSGYYIVHVSSLGIQLYVA